MTALPVFIDIEASGFGHEGYPIEVGVAFADGEQYSSLIRPAPHWQHWDDNAEALHGITRTLLDRVGQSAKVVTGVLNERLRGLTVYSDAWVVDKPWLDKLYRAANSEPSFWVSPVELILTEAQMDRWQATRDALLAGRQDQQHRAGFDARLHQEVWHRLDAVA